MALVTLLSNAALDSVGGGTISLAQNASDTQLFGITNLPTIFSVTSADLSYAFSITGAANDTFELYISVVESDGTTILAGQTSTTDYLVAEWLVDSLSSGSGTITFPFVQNVDPTAWTGAQVRLRQVYNQAQGKDNTNYVVDQASVELDFVGLDSLAANDIESITNVDSPTFNQTQTLNVNSVESFSEVSNPAYVDTVGLFANSIESITEAGSPTFNQTQILSSSSIESITNVESPTFNQTQILNSTSIESITNVESPTLNQTQVLNSSSIESITNVESPTLNQTQVLNSSSIESITNVGSPTFNQTQILNSSSIESITNVDSPTFNQIQILNSSSIESLSIVDSPVFSEIRNFTANSIESLSEISFFYPSIFVNLPEGQTVLYINTP